MEALMDNMPVFRTVRLVDIDSGKYQRGINYQQCKKIKDNFDGNLFGTPLVSLNKDGRYNVIDGHHRLTALRMMGKRSVICQVLTDLSYEDEARLFEKYNRNRICISSKDVLRARVEAKHTDSIEMVRLTQKAGYICGNISGRKKNAIRVNAISALESAYKKLGAEMFYDMLDATSTAWVGNKDAVGASMLNGLNTFYLTYGKQINKETFIKAVEHTTPQIIISKARAHGDVNLRQPIAEELWKLYNKRARGEKRLPYLF